MESWVLVLWMSFGGGVSNVPGYASLAACMAAAEAAKEPSQFGGIPGVKTKCIPGPRK